MNKTLGATKDLVLVGGGHANIQVLKFFAMNPVPGLRLTLISDVLYAPYSGMLPGHLAGWYSFDQVHFDLRRICQQAGCRFILGAVTGWDRDQKTIEISGRPDLGFDALSINVGIQPVPLKTEGALGAQRHISLKPIGGLLSQWTTFTERLESEKKTEPLNIGVVGGGAAGLEISVVLAQVLKNKKISSTVTLVSRGASPLARQSPRAQSRALKVLRRLGIQTHFEAEALSFDGQRLRLKKQDLKMDFVFCATQAKAPTWIQEAGFPCDDNGFLQVENTLAVRGEPDIFGAGDCISFQGPSLPKAGVYAVRQGPVLARNLYNQIVGNPLKGYKPQKQTLFLVTTGPKKALASYGPLTLESKLMWTLKDKIDRSFMGRFQTLPPMKNPSRHNREGAKALLNTCGGCGSKVGPAILKRVLNKVKQSQNFLGSEDLGSEDCGVIPGFQEGIGLHNLDGFRGFTDDPYLLGRVATEHALNDVYAMGGEPSSAQVLLALPSSAPSLMERDLFQVMAGVTESLSAGNVQLAGGHTMEGLEMMVGLSVLGSVKKPIKKSALQQDQVLVLTKPLGSGALLAAAMEGDVSGKHLQAVFQSMVQNQRKALAILVDHGVTGLTDVTGFGLAGHLLEMLQTTDLGVELHLSQIPIFEGFQRAVAMGHQSHLSQSLKSSGMPKIKSQVAVPEVLFDPQTSGGLLGSLPPKQASACLKALHQGGYGGARAVGRVTGAQGKKEVLILKPS